jgi:hypothetical protein
MNLTKDQINLVLYLLGGAIRDCENDYVNQDFLENCKEVKKIIEESLND